jgi:hypothetical protein
MLWINSKRTRWQAACSKSLLMVFIVQILLSAACVSTANADIISKQTPIVAHCHNESMKSDMDHMNNSHDMSACSHCDIPDMGLSLNVSSSVDMTPILLAIIALPDMPVMLPTARVAMIEQRAPPHSSSLLHHTNQRILI